jgi:hypothetical protein
MPEGKGALGKPKHKRVETTKMDLREIELGGTDWIDLVHCFFLAISNSR